MVVCALGVVALFWGRCGVGDPLRLADPPGRRHRVGAVLATQSADAGARHHGRERLPHVLRPVAGDPGHRHALLPHAPHSRGRIPVWAAPAPGRHRALGLARKDFDGIGATARGEHGSLRPERRPEHAVRQPRAGDPRSLGATCATPAPSRAARTPTPFTVAWHYATVTVIAALAAATVIGLLV